MRVTAAAIRRLRDLAGLDDWSNGEIRSRLACEVHHARKDGDVWRWRGQGTEAAGFQIAGRRYVAVIGNDLQVPGGRALVMVLVRDERDDRVAAQAAEGA